MNVYTCTLADKVAKQGGQIKCTSSFIAIQYTIHYSKTLVQFKKQSKNILINLMYLNAVACVRIVSAVKCKPRIEVFPGEEYLGQHLCPERSAVLDSHYDLVKRECNSSLKLGIGFTMPDVVFGSFS